VWLRLRDECKLHEGPGEKEKERGRGQERERERERESKDAPRARAATWCPREASASLGLLTTVDPAAGPLERGRWPCGGAFGPRQISRGGARALLHNAPAQARTRDTCALLRIHTRKCNRYEKPGSLWRHLHLTVARETLYQFLHAGKTRASAYVPNGVVELRKPVHLCLTRRRAERDRVQLRAESLLSLRKRDGERGGKKTSSKSQWIVCAFLQRNRRHLR